MGEGGKREEEREREREGERDGGRSGDCNYLLTSMQSR